jgi:transcriptional regulator with XRE-family HTH domain
MKLPAFDGTAEHLRLRTELKRLRHKAGLSQRDVAAALSWSPSKAHRIETGDARVAISDLRTLATLYGVHDPGTVEYLLALARAARVQPWQAYRDVHSGQMLRFLAHESDATIIRHLAGLLIPDLLQTQAYTRAVLEADLPPLTPQRSERLLDILTRRQSRLHAPGRLPRIVSLLDESALHRTVGGPDVTGGQLRHLEALAQRANIRIRILPFRAGAYPGMGTAFTHLAFATTAHADLVHVDRPPARPRKRHDPAQARAGHERDPAPYLETFQHLETLALTAGDSLTMIRAALTQDH